MVGKKTKQWIAKSHFVTVTNCPPGAVQDEVVAKFKEFLPAFVSLSLCCERHKDADQVHYHVFWHGKKKWAFSKATWKPLREWLKAKNEKFKRYEKALPITHEEWMVEKWRYCNNLVNKEFKESKGDAKGQLWVYNEGEAYDVAKGANGSKLTPDAEILKSFSEGVSLVHQYESAEWTRRAYIAKHRDTLSKMIRSHKRFMKDLKKRVPRFTKEDFHCLKVAEEHDFSEKCLVIYGDPGVGKTQYAKTFFANPLLVRHFDKLKQFDDLEHDGIIFDDMSWGEKTHEEAVHIFDVDEETDINVKNGMITLPAQTPRIFITNRVMRYYEETFEKKRHVPHLSFLPDVVTDAEVGAVDRRYTLVVIDGDLRKGLIK